MFVFTVMLDQVGHYLFKATKLISKDTKTDMSISGNLNSLKTMIIITKYNAVVYHV